MQRLLLIGGSGHIGYALVNEIFNVLNLNNIKVTILTRNNKLPSYFPKHKNINFRQYNSNDINTIKISIIDTKPTTIIYLSSDNDNTKSADLFKSSEVNLFLPLKILFLIKEIDLDIKYIFLSSSLSNMQSNKFLVYSINKQFAEMYIYKFSEYFKLNSNVILLPSLFGPGDTSQKRLISSYIISLLRRKKIEIKNGLKNKITIVSSQEIANIFLKTILNDNYEHFYDLIDSKKIVISIGDLLKSIDFIHSSNIKSENLYKEIFIKNNRNIYNYEILFNQLIETYKFINKNINLI